ncbi:arylalkylamine N-acetyltransferase-like 2 [Drosophila takahashii]|uniref:arylalkylamine N-acetyltransferase-like 2 n=1 Tax=Drosophila takahashii TaxID=29030 RepID=UPI001CF8E589|nr:arylalkylamine N-acetyltransferase-like 2 [Drosophila takahashii]
MESNLKDGVNIRIMDLRDYKQVKPFLKNEFFNAEPLYLSLSCGKPFQPLDEEQWDEENLSMIAQGMCLVALDEQDGNRLVGCALAGSLFPEDYERHRRMAENADQTISGHLNVYLYKLESGANIFERYGISKALLSRMTTVAGSKRGKGLGSRLAKTLMELGRTKGFPVMVANCTSFYSARQKESLGMECIYSLAHVDFKDNQGRVTFTPPPPHTMTRVMAIKL